MKWINSSAGTVDNLSVLNYMNEEDQIVGCVQIDHDTKKISWYVGSNPVCKGPARNIAHGKRVVEQTVK